MQTHNVDPVYNEESTCLILGTFPSVKSREAQFFYAHPQNRFWKTLASIFSCSVPQTISEKKEFLLENHIALWDVIYKCDITGSSDSSIKHVVPNDLSIILTNANIQNIYANGNKSYDLYMSHCYPKAKREIIRLPSTSPANAAYSLEKLISAWQVIK